MKWQETRQLAASLLGDDSQAPEFTENAIERTVKYLASRPPLGIDETSAVFMRFYRQEVRRTRARRSRLSLRGITIDLPIEATAPQTSVDSRLDLEAMLRCTRADVRTALLLRYGRNEQWKDVAASTGTTEEAIRKSCQRELQRIRRRAKQLGLNRPKLGSGVDGPERIS
jgi:DNA-directed RNA polymerase specialized sigma24 family protein